MTVEKEKLLSSAAVCDLIGISYNQLLFFRENSDMPRIRVGRRFYYLESSILSWLKELETKGAGVAIGSV